MLFAISFVRGIADSAKGPSVSAMIADHTDEKDLAKAYSWYTTVKSTSGGIGEARGRFPARTLLILVAGRQTVTANVAVLDALNVDGQSTRRGLSERPGRGRPRGDDPGRPGEPAAAPVARVEQREVNVRQVPIEDLPKVFDNSYRGEKRSSRSSSPPPALLSALFLIQIYIQATKDKKEKKDKKKAKGAAAPGQQAPTKEAREPQPNVWAFALMGAR